MSRLQEVRQRLSGERPKQPFASLTQWLVEPALTKLVMASYLIVTMEDTVGIADLKSRLSEYLRKVRAGRSITVLDRETPVARIVPFEVAGTPLVIRRPRPGAPAPGKAPLPPPLAIEIDVLELLRDERQGER
jgi:prevent-host-death family protein